MDCSTPGFTVPHYLPEFAQIHVHWVGDAIQLLILCHLLLLLLSIFLSIRVFSKGLTLPITWPKYWSFSISISPSSEYSGLISFRIDLCDLLEVQGTLKSLLHYPNSKASIFQCSAFFMVQLSHPYMTTGKTIALTIRTFVGKVIALLFNILSRFEGIRWYNKDTSIVECLDHSECWINESVDHSPWSIHQNFTQNTSSLISCPNSNPASFLYCFAFLHPMD